MVEWARLRSLGSITRVIGSPVSSWAEKGMVRALVRNGRIPGPAEALMGRMPGSPRGRGGSLRQSPFPPPCILPTWQGAIAPRSRILRKRFGSFCPVSLQWEPWLGLSEPLRFKTLMTKHRRLAEQGRKHTPLWVQILPLLPNKLYRFGKSLCPSQAPFSDLKRELDIPSLLG